MKLFFAAITLSITCTRALAQEPEIVFQDPPEDTSTVSAQPVLGLKALLNYLEAAVSEGDTLGKKYPVHLYNVRLIVKEDGTIDSTYVVTPHSACPVHKKIAEQLKNTKWQAARERGKPVRSEQELIGKIRLNKSVLKKYNCR